MNAWSEEAHPRVPGGQSGGGEFTSGGSGERSKVSSYNLDPKTGTRDVNKVKAGLNAIPAHHAELIKNVPITVKQKITGVFGDGDGKAAAGLFSWGDGKPSILIAQGKEWKSSDGRVFNVPFTMGMEATTVHELGHALDHASGWAHGTNSEFRRAFETDMQALSKKDLANGAYFFNSPKERFAELYSLAHEPRRSASGKFFGGITRPRAEKVFANSLAWIRKL